MERPALNTARLWAISVATSAAAEEAVSALLERITGRCPASYTEAGTGQTTVTVYCVKRSEWTSTRRVALAAGLDDLRAGGVAVGPAKLAIKRLTRRDWAEAWMRHFRPLVIGGSLLIKPGWSRRRPRPGQVVVVLDPGLSFGTGQHPTTAFCLEQLVECRQPGKSQSCLDVGTGSGILAIAAAKLGYRPVVAWDHDPAAVRVARANARRNRVQEEIRFLRADLTQVPPRSTRRHAVLCANLTADLLVRERQRLIDRLAPSGRLVLAGILQQEFNVVRKSYEAAGLRLVASRREGEWHSGAFAWRTSPL